MVYWQNTGNCRVTIRGVGAQPTLGVRGLLPWEILYWYCLSACEVIWGHFQYALQSTVIVELFLQWKDFGVICKLVCTRKTNYTPVTYVGM